MADLLDNLETHLQGQYEISRSEIQYGKRLSIRHMEQVVNVDLYQTGKPHVSGKDGPLRAEVEKLVEGFRKDPHFFEKLAGATEAELLTPEKAIGKHISKEGVSLIVGGERRSGSFYATSCCTKTPF